MSKGQKLLDELRRVRKTSTKYDSADDKVRQYIWRLESGTRFRAMTLIASMIMVLYGAYAGIEASSVSVGKEGGSFTFDIFIFAGVVFVSTFVSDFLVKKSTKEEKIVYVEKVDK